MFKRDIDYVVIESTFWYNLKDCDTIEIRFSDEEENKEKDADEF